MNLNVRRAVTGHDSKRHTIVKIDEFADSVSSRRPGAASVVIRSTNSFPAINEADADQSANPGGTVAAKPVTAGGKF